MNEQNICAAFLTTLPKENRLFGGRRAKHIVYPEAGGYVHRTYWVVDKDTPDNIGVFLSERVFFGRWRLAFVEEIHTAETWATIGEIVEKMERMKQQNNTRK